MTSSFIFLKSYHIPSKYLKLKKEKNLTFKLFIRLKNSIPEELRLVYDEDKKLKLKIMNILQISSKLKTAKLIIHRYLAIDFLWINFEKVDDAAIQNFIDEFNKIESFTNSKSKLKTIEFYFKDCNSLKLKSTEIQKNLKLDRFK